MTERALERVIARLLYVFPLWALVAIVAITADAFQPHDRIVELSALRWRLDRLEARAPSGAVAPPAEGVGVVDDVHECLRRTDQLRTALETLVHVLPRPARREHVPAISGWRVGQAYEPSANETKASTSAEASR